MPRKKITAAAVERLRAPASGQVDYFDMAFPALALRVTANGVRSWVYFGRVHGKLKRATLGRWPVMSLKAARLKAGEVADTMRAGIDPAATKRAARLAVADSFAAVADEWLKRDQAENRQGYGFLDAGGQEFYLNRRSLVDMTDVVKGDRVQFKLGTSTGRAASWPRKSAQSVH
jgi:hypothetical protein